MIKLILLLFIPLASFGQIIVYEQLVELEPSVKAQAADHLIKLKPQTKLYTDQINITEIQDEYIEIIMDIGPSIRHLLISSKNNVPLNLSSPRFKMGKHKLNIYDGDKLISLPKMVDILNYFDKYGFEFVETINNISGSSTINWTGFFSTTSYKGKSSMVFRNNNN
tara:strand:- start:125 stop:622 length:498 start_codon:yes stop_codon:yes gene_type:complete